jgi:hypothetical protein
MNTQKIHRKYTDSTQKPSQKQHQNTDREERRLNSKTMKSLEVG